MNLAFLLAALPFALLAPCVQGQTEVVPPKHDGDGLRVGEAADVGIDRAGLDAALGLISEAVEQDHIRGAVVLVARRHTIVAHEAFGVRDLEGERPMQVDSLFRMASNTKAITAAAVLALVDDGKVALDDKVHRWFPTFDHGHGSDIEIRHLLTHTSGLRIPTLFVQPLMKPSEEHPDAPNLVLEVARFGEIGPTVEPGTSYSYNNPGYNTLAGLVEVVSKKPFAKFVAERFYEPLGMTESCHHETVADQERMSAVFRNKTEDGWQVDWQPGDPPTVPFVRGSGGMISTAYDYAVFCQMVLNGGTYNGKRVLSEEIVAASTRQQTEHGKGSVRYGFGFMVRDDGVFEHGGSDGTWSWCDPGRELIGIVFTQSPGREADELRLKFRERVTAACGSD